MAPETHTRYRVQKLIRYGEWLEQNADVIYSLMELLDDRHSDAMEALTEDKVDEYMAFEAVYEMTQSLSALRTVLRPLSKNFRYDCKEFEVEMGKDVTLYQPYACKEHRYQVVMKAPTAKVEETPAAE